MADKEDGVNEDGESSREYVPSARDRMIEDLAAKSEAFRNQQAEQFGAEQNAAGGETTEPTGEAAAAAAPSGEAASTELDASTQIQRQSESPRKVKVKVDGQELEVDESDLVASYQMREAAARRLQEATQARDEANRLREQARAATPATPAPTDEDRKQKLTEYHEALYAGDSEKAAKLFDEVMGTGRGDAAIPDLSAIAERVTPVVRAAISNQSALEKFHTDYKDVVDDPVLVSIAQGKVDKLVADGTPFAEALAQAGNETRTWIQSKSTIPAAGNEPTTRSEKLAKKGEIVNLPNANARAASQPTEKPQSNSDYVSEMKRRRGQA